MKTKITVTPTSRSAITALKAKFVEAGIEPAERKFTFAVDQQRDNYRPGRRVSDLGAGLRPIEQPKRRKSGGKAINQIKRREINHKITEVICVSCGATIQAKSKKRMFCDDKCKNNEDVKRARAEREAKKKVGE